MNALSFIGDYCTAGGELQACLQGLYNMGLAISIALAFLIILRGAFKYLMGAIPNQKADGKSDIINAIVGLGIIAVSGTVLYWVNPNIFNAELITYKVTELTVPIFSISPQEQQAIIAGEAGGGSTMPLPGRTGGGPGTLGVKACDQSVLTTISVFNGKSVRVHRGVATSLKKVSKAWEQKGGNNFYKIGDIGSYNCRPIKTPEGRNTGRYSSHAYGLAIDINCLQNPFRRNLCITNMPADFRKLFNDEGWGWGGDWISSKDPMHFSKAPNERGDGKIE